jgi:predicted Zn finger-like uncharacterized protein
MRGRVMKTQCPKCGFEGDIKDDLIPEEGQTVGCPQCKTTFMIRRDNITKKPDTNGSARRDMEVNGRGFIPSRQREAKVPRARTDRLVTRVVVLVLSFVVVFVIGLFVGRYTHTYTINNPLKKKEVAPAGFMTPVSSIEGGPETTAPVAVPATPAETTDADTAQPSEPLILEEDFTSDDFTDISDIDAKLNETTAVTGLQRELELKEFAGDLVGKMLLGYFVVRDVGKLGPLYAKKLPTALYTYYIEAEDDSADPMKSVIYVGLKGADELSSSLDKGSKVYIQGFIYSCLFVSDHFELGIVNPKVESSR